MSDDSSGAESRGRKGRKRPTPLVRRPAPRSPREARQVNGAPPPPSARRSRASKHPLVLLLNLCLTLLVFAVLGAGGLLYWGRMEFQEPGPLAEDRTVDIQRGNSVGDIAALLEEYGVISNRWVFMSAAQLLDTSRQMQAGEYLVPARATMAEVMEQLVDGQVVQHDITVAEGLTSAQVVDLLNEDPILSGNIERIPQEGSLLPETYKYTRGMSRTEMIERMQRAHDLALEAAWEGRAEDLPLESPRDLVTLASIVEKETAQADERARVAGVFVNRLEQGMKLQSDPTILYGLYGGAAWSKPRTIFRSDLERPNPYNTYQIDGLPPGPIANPGASALQAVANPSRTDDLYFVADGTGGHAFAESYAEHQRNVEKWREIERQRESAATSN